MGGQPWEAGQPRRDNPERDNPGEDNPGGSNPSLGENPKKTTQLFPNHCRIYCLISTIALEVIPPKGVDVNQECQCGKILDGNPNEGLLSIANLANKIVGGNPAEKVEFT